MLPAEVVAEIFRRVLIPGVQGDALSIEKPFGRRAAFAAAECVGGFAAAECVGGFAAASEEVAMLDEWFGASTMQAGEECLLRKLRRLANADLSALGPRIDGGVVALAALFHDLVAAFHPDLPGAFRRDAPGKLLMMTADALREIPAPPTVRAALLRHAWLGDLPRFSLVRSDVKWWVGGRSFIGRTPPARLLAWPEVRRVRRENRAVELLRAPDLFGDRGDVALLTELHARAMSAFLAATPLTDLALAGRLSPPFTWTAAAAQLVANAAGARLARRAIALGEDGGKFARDAIASVAGDAAATLS